MELGVNPQLHLQPLLLLQVPLYLQLLLLLLPHQPYQVGVHFYQHSKKVIGYGMITIISLTVNGEWSQWGSFGVCAVNGKRQRARSCTNPAPLNGKQCSGSSKEEVSCECAEGWSSNGESCYCLYGTQEQLT